jgi:iron complex transport system substrate-binding protein
MIDSLSVRVLILSILLSTLLPAVSAAGSSSTLDIFGNANLDDAIDDRDVAYVEEVIQGTKSTTYLADANQDNVVDKSDIEQIEAIINGDEKELTLIDSNNRTVTVNIPLQRVATTNRHFLEVLQSLKASKDTIVGVPEGIKRPGYSLLYPDFQDKPAISGGENPSSEPDCEALLKLKPDVAIIYGYYNGSDAAQNVLESAGIKVIRLSFNRPNVPGLFKTEVTKAGYLFGKKKAADDLLAFYDHCSELVEEKVKDLSDNEKPKVYSEAFTNPYVTTVRYAHIETCGGKNIFPGNGSEDSYAVDPEEVIKDNPDIIIKMVPSTTVCGYDVDADNTSNLQEIRDEILNRKELKNVNAIKNGKVYVISGHIMAAGPFSGVKYFIQDLYQAKWLHPDLFKDLDPKAIHQEYLTKFQGLDIDLEKNGVFVYPEA